MPKLPRPRSFCFDISSSGNESELSSQISLHASSSDLTHYMKDSVFDSGVDSSPEVSPKRLFTFTKPIREWRLFRYFGQEGNADGKFMEANGIVCCPKGDIIVTNLDIASSSSKLYYFNKDGLYLSTLKPLSKTIPDVIINPWDVAITSKGVLVVSDQSKYVKLYDMRTNSLSSFSVLLPEEDQETEVTTSSVVVTKNDDVIVGDSSRCVITVHCKHDNWIPRKIHVPIKPIYIATNNQKHIFITDWSEGKMLAMNFQGDVLFIIDKFNVDGDHGVPQGLTCDPEGNVYIAVIKYDEKTGTVIAGTGHIHQYDGTGVFIRCILKGLFVPRGITMSNMGSIYVANQTSIVILSPQTLRRPLRRRCTVSIMSSSEMM